MTLRQQALFQNTTITNQLQLTKLLTIIDYEIDQTQNNNKKQVKHRTNLKQNEVQNTRAQGS